MVIPAPVQAAVTIADDGMAFATEEIRNNAADGNTDGTAGIQVGTCVIRVQRTCSFRIAEEFLHSRGAIVGTGSGAGIGHIDTQTRIKAQCTDLLVGLQLFRACGNQRHGVPVICSARAVAAAEVHGNTELRSIVRFNTAIAFFHTNGLLRPLEVAKNLSRTSRNTTARRVVLVAGFVKGVALVINSRCIVVVDTTGLRPTGFHEGADPNFGNDTNTSGTRSARCETGPRGLVLLDAFRKFTTRLPCRSDFLRGGHAVCQIRIEQSKQGILRVAVKISFFGDDDNRIDAVISGHDDEAFRLQRDNVAKNRAIRVLELFDIADCRGTDLSIQGVTCGLQPVFGELGRHLFVNSRGMDDAGCDNHQQDKKPRANSAKLRSIKLLLRSV